MSRTELRKSAQAFVKEQVEIMRTHGSDPRLNRKQLSDFVKDVETSLARVAGVKRAKPRRAA
jgi:hypothetical protein